MAIPISRDQLYLAWLDPSTFAIVDVFVMNFRTHTVYDYALGSAHPEIADASVVCLAQDGDDILTSDPGDLLDLARASGVHLELIPV